MRKHCALRSETELNNKVHPVPRTSMQNESHQTRTTRHAQSRCSHGHAQPHTTTSCNQRVIQHGTHMVTC